MEGSGAQFRSGLISSLGFLDNNYVKAHLQKQELANERCCRYYFDYYSNSVKRKSELYFERF